MGCTTSVAVRPADPQPFKLVSDTATTTSEGVPDEPDPIQEAMRAAVQRGVLEVLATMKGHADDPEWLWVRADAVVAARGRRGSC
jgi:hypothetical protein